MYVLSFVITTLDSIDILMFKMTLFHLIILLRLQRRCSLKFVTLVLTPLRFCFETISVDATLAE